jgi:hypothetical protein
MDAAERGDAHTVDDANGSCGADEAEDAAGGSVASAGNSMPEGSGATGGEEVCRSGLADDTFP